MPYVSPHLIRFLLVVFHPFIFALFFTSYYPFLFSLAFAVFLLPYLHLFLSLLLLLSIHVLPILSLTILCFCRSELFCLICLLFRPAFFFFFLPFSCFPFLKVHHFIFVSSNPFLSPLYTLSSCLIFLVFSPCFIILPALSFSSRITCEPIIYASQFTWIIHF